MVLSMAASSKTQKKENQSKNVNRLFQRHIKEMKGIKEENKIKSEIESLISRYDPHSHASYPF